MNNEQLLHFQAKTSLEKMDDLHVLTRAFSLPELNYMNISRQERLIKMMACWPLLSELAQKEWAQKESAQKQGSD